MHRECLTPPHTHTQAPLITDDTTSYNQGEAASTDGSNTGKPEVQIIADSSTGAAIAASTTNTTTTGGEKKRKRATDCHDWTWSDKMWKENANEVTYYVMINIVVYIALAYWTTAYDGFTGIDNMYLITATLTTVALPLGIKYTYA
jgi:hypothetical protein